MDEIYCAPCPCLSLMFVSLNCDADEQNFFEFDTDFNFYIRYKIESDYVCKLLNVGVHCNIFIFPFS